VAESNLNQEQEPQKRRTTRIVQAVPLTVMGVDALGRPFQERTSTLTINCQGCRYQSKHYVLKNMWVTLEVPHNEPGHEARTVRARVTWIQRPRTVRELFQIGVELEVPGNVWGIAFPPADWFPFPESSKNLELAPPPETVNGASETQDWTAEEGPAARAAEPAESNVRVLPIPGGADPSIQLARQLTRLVAEAKQQIHSAARESANEAVATETRSLMAELHAQLMDAAQRAAAAAVSARLEDTQQEILEQRQKDQEAALWALREEISRELTQRITEARQQLDAQLAEVERTRQGDFEIRLQNQLQEAVQKVESATRALGATENEVRVAVEQMRLSSEQAATDELRRWQEQMDQRSADAQARLAQMDLAAKSLKEQIAAAAAIGEAGWRGVLDADLESATDRWRERTETLIEDASRNAGERFGKNAEAVGRQIEEQLQRRINVVGDAQAQLAAETENLLSMLRAAVNQEVARGEAMYSQLQQSATQLETKHGEFSARLDGTCENLAQRNQAVLEAQSAELSRQAESVVTGMAERLQSVLETSGHETMDRLVGELDQRLAPQLARVTEATAKLVFDRDHAEQALADHQERVWKASDRNLQDTVARGKELLAQLETEFGESARGEITRLLSELESKATETTQGTFEALFKTADWYEKKVQNQMQTTLQKGTEQAAAHLREKAAEMSGVFARELDHCSRSYVEHAQGQIQESAGEAAERIAKQIAQLGDAAATNFQERAGQVGQQQFEAYTSKTKAAFEQNTALMENSIAQVRSKLENEARGFAMEFQRALSQHMQQTLGQGMRELGAQIDQAKASLINESQALERQYRMSLQPLANTAMDEHKKRLENASNSWLLTTVSKLNQQSETLIAQMVEATERKLKAVCNTVISEMGATLRQRLTGIAAPLKPPEGQK
jgi:hypothetical protein